MNTRSAQRQAPPGCTLTRYRAFALCLLCGLLLLPAPAPAQAQSGTTGGTMSTTRGGTFIIGVAMDMPPFAAQAANGQSIGFDLDLLKTLVRTAGLRVSYEAVPFIQLIPGVATQLYDAAIGCITDTEERRALVDFSSPYFTTGSVFAVAAESTPLYDLTDLTPETTVSTMSESASWRFLQAQGTAEVVAAASPQAALELAAARVTDAAFVDEIIADRYIRTRPESRLRSVSGLVTTGHCAIAVSKGNPRLLLELNAALTRLQNNGKYLTIYRRWFGSRPLAGPRPASRPVSMTPDRQGLLTNTLTTTLTTTTSAPTSWLTDTAIR